MKALAISILVASICVLNGTAEDGPREALPTTESPRTEMDEPALPTPERNPVDSSPDLLPESNELPEHVPAEHSTYRKAVATTAKENIEEKQRFERIRLQAMNNPRAAYLLKRANHSLRSATRRSYLRAYYVNVTERMRKLDPELKSSVDAYEQAKLQEIGEESVSARASSHRIVNRKTRKTHYASRRSHTHHRYHERGMVIEDPYGPDYVPYYGPPVVFYPW